MPSVEDSNDSAEEDGIRTPRPQEQSKSATASPPKAAAPLFPSLLVEQRRQQDIATETNLPRQQHYQPRPSELTPILGRMSLAEPSDTESDEDGQKEQQQEKQQEQSADLLAASAGKGVIIPAAQQTDEKPPTVALGLPITSASLRQSVLLARLPLRQSQQQKEGEQAGRASVQLLLRLPKKQQQKPACFASSRPLAPSTLLAAPPSCPAHLAELTAAPQQPAAAATTGARAA
ncbi:hypothetical protein cyc_08954 [Cyclospora cayetanensis]|uniref:Uncharacterized protein n=1 Tax=Cyclospora cayetanensis TaxID=88456 RepID=A0A1D3D2D2_9EIME|nr:hypothetical protein cyc_08954 [Cyclospora cayetanensis]